MRSGDLHVVRFDAEQRKVIGEPSLLQAGVAMESFFRQAQYAISDEGTLVYVPGGDRSAGRIASMARNGETKLLPLPTGLYGVFDVSPDERRLAVEVSDATKYIWVHDLERNECHGCAELFYRNGARWYSVRTSGEAPSKWEPARLVWETDFIDTPGRSYDVSSDGKRLLVSKSLTPYVTDRIHLIQNWRPARGFSADAAR